MAKTTYYLTILFLALKSARLFVALSVASEILNLFRVFPLALALKICVDIPKEIIKINLFYK